MDTLQHLQTESRNPASTNLDELTPLQLVRLMNSEDAKIIPAVASQAEAMAKAVEVIADHLRAGGRLIYAGAGTSGRLGVLDATECPPTFNASPDQVVGLIAGGPAALTRAVEGAEDDPAAGVADLQSIHFSANDVLVGIAASGRTPYVIGAVDYARKLGAFTVGVSCNTEAELIQHVDLPITPVAGPEVLSGSTRLKAGTATKLVLNTLTTGAMVRLGKAFGNLMVDVRATNAKLVVRTNRIVRAATGLDWDAADALLGRCNREVKTALVSHLAGVSADEARERLKTAGGQVRAAVGATAADGAEFAGRLVLGVDGGGTHTVALLATPTADGWKLLGRGEGGPGNRQAAGHNAAMASISEATGRAFAAAGVKRRPVDAACLGLAGAGRPDDQAAVRDWALGAKLAESVEVCGDSALLLAAGTPEGWGVAVVAGTGSMAFARSPDGRTARAGGWGYLLGDEGSGYAVALAGLRAAVRAADGRGPATRLVDGFLEQLRLCRADDLVGVVHRSDRPALAALAAVVVAAADDPVADGILADAAGELAAAVAAAARPLGLGSPLPLALAGGMLASAPGYRERLMEALAARGLTADPVALVGEPAEGAVRTAVAALACVGAAAHPGRPVL
jgi:N-acetylmuramic acid 6-phosphate etherase